MVSTCKNCNKKFIGQYCNYCGQPAHTHDINIAYVWHEIQHGLFHIDKGILYTTKELFTRPGYSIKEYIAGKRVKHFKPVAYLIILSTIYVLLAHLLKIEFASGKAYITLNGVGDVKSSEVSDIVTHTIAWIKEHYAYSTLILLPVISFSTYLAFRKSKYNYLKHLILNCFIAGQRTIIFIVALPILAIVKNKEAISIIENIETLIWVALMTWTYIQFFDNNKIFKNISLTLLSYIYLFIQTMILLIAFITAIVLIYAE